MTRLLLLSSGSGSSESPEMVGSAGDPRCAPTVRGSSGPTHSSPSERAQEAQRTDAETPRRFAITYFICFHRLLNSEAFPRIQIMILLAAVITNAGPHRP